MGKWNEAAAPNNNMASEELEASNFVANQDKVRTSKDNDAAGNEERVSPGNRRSV